MKGLAIIVALFVGLCAPAVADRNFTIQHFSPGSNCQGNAFLTQQWSKPGENLDDCATNVPTGLTVQNSPLAYKAYCEKTTLTLLDAVNILRLELYFQAPNCGFGGTNDETPTSARVGISGSTCYRAGQLFPQSDVKIEHDCLSSGTVTLETGMISAIIIILAMFSIGT